jgi:predicted RNase H-like HicB family nuclease
MSIVGRTFEQAIKKGQQSMDVHMKTITEQNNTIIDNMNEIIDLQKKICDKLEIKYKEEN